MELLLEVSHCEKETRQGLLHWPLWTPSPCTWVVTWATKGPASWISGEDAEWIPARTHGKDHLTSVWHVCFLFNRLLNKLELNMAQHHLLSQSLTGPWMTASWALHYCEWSESRSVLSNSLQLHGLYSPRNSPGQNTGVGNLSLLQGIFPTQGSNPGLPHCRQILYQLSHKGNPKGSNIITPLKLSSQRSPVISCPLSKSKVFSFCWCPSVFDTYQCFMFPEILSFLGLMLLFIPLVS